MEKLPQDFDWKKSESHIWLLSKYIKPSGEMHSDEYIRDWSERLKENLSDAIDRFIREGMLINCKELNEILCVSAFNYKDLIEIAKEEGFYSHKNRKKFELVEQFIIKNRSKAEKIASNIKALKCSQLAKDFLDHNNVLQPLKKEIEKLPQDFDWKKSESHIWLLSYYIKPRFVVYNDDDDKNMFYTLKESVSDAVNRFIREGMLITCELNEILYCVMTIAELKNIAKVYDFKLTGTKTELIERFIIANRYKAEELASNIKALKCSQLAKDFLENHEQEKNLAKTKSFEALLENDSKKAHMIFLSYQRKYSGNAFVFFEDGTYNKIRKMGFILNSNPDFLGNISSSDLISLRAAICMDELWGEESAEKWLPEKFTSPLKSNKVAINYLKCNTKIIGDLNEQIENFDIGIGEKFRLEFNEDDDDSCSLCLQFKDKIFELEVKDNVLKLKDFPELPIKNCTSDKGCQCRLFDVYNDNLKD